MKEFNEWINNGYAYRKHFPGPTTKDIAHYCLPTLIDDKRDSCIIHVGKNSLNKENPAEIVNDILRIVEICRIYGVNDVHVASITYRVDFQKLVSQINDLLRAKQFLNNFSFIENDNITAAHIWRDKLHLNNNGTIVLANNFIKSVNRKHIAWLKFSSIQNSLLNGQSSPNHSILDFQKNEMHGAPVGQINTNSIRNKFEPFKKLVKGNLDIIVVTESKLDESFPQRQFLIAGYNLPFRADRNRNGGGIIIYVREDIPCREIEKTHSTKRNLEGIFLELNLRRSKILLFGGYK